MLHAGLDLSRKKIDVSMLSDQGEHLWTSSPSRPTSTRFKGSLAESRKSTCEPVCAVIGR